MTKIISSKKAYFRAVARTFSKKKKESIVIIKQFHNVKNENDIAEMIQTLYFLIIRNEIFRKRYAKLMVDAGEYRNQNYRNVIGAIVSAVAGLGGKIAGAIESKNQSKMQTDLSANEDVQMMMQYAMQFKTEQAQAKKTQTNLVIASVVAFTAIIGVIIWKRA